MLILAMLLGLVYLVIWIIVLVKQFQIAGPVHGIIGIITCSIWTFIWGWMNADKAGIKNLMLIWTVVLVLRIVLGFIYGFSLYAAR
ncbi:MAG: hypothetical protein V7641_1326 [Blastocatellia bacterium]